MAMAMAGSGEHIELDDAMIDGSLKLMALASGKKVDQETIRKAKNLKRIVAARRREEDRINLRAGPEEIARRPPFPDAVKDFVGLCSTPIRKQVFASDVKRGQCRLKLPKAPVDERLKGMPLRLAENVRKGIPVTVYGPDGSEYAMNFTIWTQKNYVINSKGWNKFCQDYGLRDLIKMATLAIWMFRHRRTDGLCFAITW